MRKLARALFLVALVLAGAIAVFKLARGVDTDLFAMVGRSPRDRLADLQALSADAIRVACADTNRAARLRARYPFDPPIEPATLLETMRTHGRGLLAPQDRDRLERGEFDRIRRSVKRRDYSGVGLFAKADDPYYFLSDFVMALKALEPRGDEGVPAPSASASRESAIGKDTALSFGAGTPSSPQPVILTGSARAIEAAVPSGLLSLVREAEADDALALSGAPFHSAIARARTIREVNVLGALSLVAVLVFGWLLFRSFRFVLPMTAAIACGLVAATGAVCLLPGRPHALTFLFGTTLIGLGVDYCYHALARERVDRTANAAGGEHFVRDLTGALVTTCLAFAPLLFSSVSVLRQMAVFSIAGLVAIYAFVLLMSTRPRPRGHTETAAKEGRILPLAAVSGRWRGRPCVRLCLLALALLAFSLFTFPFSLSSDPALFHRPAPVMARGEARFAELAGGAAGLRLVDFTAWQEENAALKAKLEQPRGAFLTAADLPSGLAFERGGHTFLALPETVAAAIVGDAGEKVDLKAQLAALFARLTREAFVLAGIALVCLLLGTLLVFRRRALAISLPPLAAAGTTALTLALVGEPITFFHVLCFFILIGLGIDYSIFENGGAHGVSAPLPEHRSATRSARGILPSLSGRVVLFSFLTSLVGFGLLAFTSFPVTRGMGLTLAIGLAWAYVFARVGASPDAGTRASPLQGSRPAVDFSDSLSWARQREQSAGRFRILLLWYFYRFFGKSVAKVLFFPAFLFIYPFCRPARAALAQYYAILGVTPRPFRHLLSFAWSMFDKTDACTLCKNPPRFTLSGDTGWMRGGCFLLSTHLGCIEVLPAFGAGTHHSSDLLRKQPSAGGYSSPQPSGTEANPPPRVHAFQQMGHDAVFTRIFAEHLDPKRLSLAAVEDIGVETAVEMQAAIRGGDIVLMAADRLSAGSGTGKRGPVTRRRELKHDFLGQACVWPKGVFRFAKLMESPVYAIVCVQTGWNGYTIAAKRLGADLLGDYVTFLEENVRTYPYQWYQFYPFFTP